MDAAGRFRSPSCGRALGAGALLLLAAGSAAHAQAAAAAGDAGKSRPNIVLIVLDDFGVDLLSAFPRRLDDPPPPCTPSLDALIEEGLLFTRVWTDPICSPSRAQLLTGRHGFRTGIGQGIGEDVGSLRVDLETTLPRLLAGYDSAALGKWHLMGFADGTADHPLDAGFGDYAGSLFNLAENAAIHQPCRAKKPLSYVNWLKTWDTDGDGRLESRCTTKYATTDTADEAIVRARLMQPPWFLYVAFNAPHWPLTRTPLALCPPEDLCPDSACRARSTDTATRRSALVEALDTEIGRMLAAIRRHAPGTIVFVIGDNGTDTSDAEEEGRENQWEGGDRRGKGSMYESGVHVPLIAVGPGIAPGECDALVSSTDLFATIAELADAPSAAEDSVSLVPHLRGSTAPLRQTVYAEGFFPNQPNDRLGQPFAPERHGRAVRDERHKLVRIKMPDGNRELLFDLELDPLEERDLLAPGGPAALGGEDRARYERLRGELQAMGVL